jgi:hypothetical protein
VVRLDCDPATIERKISNWDLSFADNDVLLLALSMQIVVREKGVVKFKWVRWKGGLQPMVRVM